MSESDIITASRLQQDAIAKQGERIASIETELKHVATKNDITTLKVWILSGMLGGIGATITIAKFLLP